MALDISIFITYVGIIVMIFVLGKLFVWPLKMVLKLAFNSILGGLFLIAINYVGTGFGVTIPLNILNACITGILGLPGVIMLIILTA